MSNVEQRDLRPARRPFEFGAVISDLDGVVYRGEAPIPGAVEAFQHWHRTGVPYAFVTNNSTRSAASVAEKLLKMGIETRPEQVITSAVAVGRHVGERWPRGTFVHVLGAPALVDVVTEAGFVVTEGDAPVVIVGMDRDFNYDRLRRAVRAVLAGGTLIGTNPDLLLPTRDGFDPAAGTILAAVSLAAHAAPVIMGKPEVAMIEIALAELRTTREATIMIGDQTETDILAGQRAGLRTVLVESGIPGERTTEPDRIVGDLLELIHEVDPGT